VTFQVLNNATEEPVGFPVVSKVGLPLTAFTGCTGADTPLPGQGLGDSFISFGSCTTKQSLLINYSNPVSQVSGVLIDTDVWASGSYEQWTIKARDANGTTIAEMIVDPCDLPVPAIECTYGAKLN
jgi:hypothetical protein